eukprot:2184485-Alexandrium_andersonii.AAC.1
MSASLVGSEMCIRDSSSSAPAGAASGGTSLTSSSSGPWRLRAWVSELPTRLRDSRAWRACLLYTSDAADDM